MLNPKKFKNMVTRIKTNFVFKSKSFFIWVVSLFIREFIS